MSSGIQTHPAESLQSPEPLRVMLSAYLFLQKRIPIVSVTSPLKVRFVRHFFPFLMHAKHALLYKLTAYRRTIRQLVESICILFMLPFGGTFVAMLMLITNRKGGDGK